jgi:hypothetical protein
MWQKTTRYGAFRISGRRIASSNHAACSCRSASKATRPRKLGWSSGLSSPVCRQITPTGPDRNAWNGRPVGVATRSGTRNAHAPRTSWLPQMRCIGRPRVMSRPPGCSNVGIRSSSRCQSLHVSPFQMWKSDAGVTSSRRWRVSLLTWVSFQTVKCESRAAGFSVRNGFHALNSSRVTPSAAVVTERNS